MRQWPVTSTSEAYCTCPLTYSLLRRGILTARPEECVVAGMVAVWFALMLSVAARGQGFVALLTAQTGAVPVLSQGRLSLSCGHKHRH